jgi:hypothetical protein
MQQVEMGVPVALVHIAVPVEDLDATEMPIIPAATAELASTVD